MHWFVVVGNGDIKKDGGEICHKNFLTFQEPHITLTFLFINMADKLGWNGKRSPSSKIRSSGIISCAWNEQLSNLLDLVLEREDDRPLGPELKAD